MDDVEQAVQQWREWEEQVRPAGLTTGELRGRIRNGIADARIRRSPIDRDGNRRDPGE